MEQEELRLPLQPEAVQRPYDGNIATGMAWGVLISIPLWMSVIGWVTGFAH
ncbi:MULTISPECIES: hypothetical protein [Paenibacillus]|uniref:hypothetical protein n=1 Tax=Paenibacillus TaxID=44249 RepID=UPI00168BD15B|nr:MULTISPECIES: hypothetical protein [Paenibacillus]